MGDKQLSSYIHSESFCAEKVAFWTNLIFCSSVVTRQRSQKSTTTNYVESDHWLLLVDLIDVTLACEFANSKLVEGVTVADVDDQDRVGNSLLQIWNTSVGHKSKVLFGHWAQGKILKLNLKLEFGQYFAADVWSRF